MQSEAYNKYVAKMRMGCEQLFMIVNALSQASRMNTKEDIDARIQAADRAITWLQDVKRYLLYFKNRLE